MRGHRRSPPPCPPFKSSAPKFYMRRKYPTSQPIHASVHHDHQPVQCLCQGWGFIHRFVYHLLTLYLGVSHSLAAVSVLPPPALPDPSLLWGLSRLLHRGGWGWGVGDAPYVLALQQYHQISLYQQWPLFGPCWSRDGRKVKWRELMETSMHLKSSAYTRTHFMG